MLNLILCITTSVAWLLVMRAFHICKINTLQAVVCNYWVCVLTGLWILGDSIPDKTLFFSISWSKYTLVLGFMFVGTFYLIGHTAKTAGVTLATVASKASMVIPIAVSIGILGTAQKVFDFWNYMGIFLALVAVILSSFKTDIAEQAPVQRQWLLPIAVFLCNGLCDTGTNYVNWKFVQAGQEALFSILTFAAAGIGGLLMLAYSLVVQKQRFEAKSILAGIALGVPNFFSLFFMVKTLADFQNDGAFLFPIFNIGIILLGAMFSKIIYKERLSLVNLLGLGLAVLSIGLLAYQEILVKIL